MSLEAMKLDLQRMRKRIDASDFFTQQQAITVTAPSLADLDINVMDDDSAATNGTKVYVALQRGLTEQAMLWSEMANAASVNFQTDTDHANRVFDTTLVINRERFWNNS